MSNEYEFERDRLKARLIATIKQQDVPSLFHKTKILISGLPNSIQNTEMQAENIEKVSVHNLKIDKKRVSIKKQQLDENTNNLTHDLLLNIQSLCKQLLR